MSCKGYVLFGANLLNATPEKKYAVLSEKSCGDSLFVVLPQTSEDSDTRNVKIAFSLVPVILNLMFVSQKLWCSI